MDAWMDAYKPGIRSPGTFSKIVNHHCTVVKKLVIPIDRSFTCRSSCGTRLVTLFDSQVSEFTRKNNKRDLVLGRAGTSSRSHVNGIVGVLRQRG